MRRKTTTVQGETRNGIAALEPKRYGARDKTFTCPFCGHDRFKAGDYVLFFMMYTLVCGDCGHVELFKNKPEPLRA
jgi:transcription elongation factor Elf1